MNTEDLDVDEIIKQEERGLRARILGNAYSSRWKKQQQQNKNKKAIWRDIIKDFMGEGRKLGYNIVLWDCIAWHLRN